MSAVAIIQANLPADISFDDWFAAGQQLLVQDREAEWRKADWFALGRQRAKSDPAFAEQMEMRFGDLLEDRRQLDAIARVAEAFPPEERDFCMSFNAYAKLVNLPHGEASKILKQAAKDKTPPREIGYQGMQAHMTLTPRQPADEDSQCASLIHLYNRMPRSVRIEFAQMVAEADGKEIDL